MAKADISAKIGVDGASEFKKQLNDIDSSLKVLGSEMKIVTAEFGRNAKSEEALTKSNEILERSAIELRNKLELQTQALIEQAREYGEADAKTKRMQTDVNNTQAALAKAERQMQLNNQALEELANSTDNAGDEFEETGKQAADFADVLKANVIGNVVTKGIEALGTAIKKVGKAMKDTVVDAAKYADEINTMAKTTGLSTDTLQEFQYMSGLVDVDLSTITGSLSKLTKNMNTARKGTGDAATAFKNLNINITNADGSLRDNEEVFGEVLDKLGQMTNETERDAAAMAIFGKSAQELNPLILAGSDALAAYAQEAHDVGYVMDEEALGSLNSVNDSFDRMKAVVDGAKNQLAQALAPTIEDVAGKLQDWISSVDWEAVGDKIKQVADDIKSFFSFISENGDTIIAILAGIAAGFIAWNVTELVMGLVGAIKAFQTANEGATIAQAALNVVMNANPIGIVITALSALVAAIIVLWNTNEDFRNWCINAWSSITEWIKTTINNVKTWINNTWESIKQTLTSAFNFFIDIGTNIAKGIWEGISNATKWLINKITGWFNDVVGAVKRFLGIESPSKLFANEVGAMMAEGVAVGWDNEFGAVKDDIVGSMNSLLPDSSANIGVVSSMRPATNSGLADSVNAIGALMGGGNNGNLTILFEIDGREFSRAILPDFRLVQSQNPIIVNDF